jgi:hypothetical protein
MLMLSFACRKEGVTLLDARRIEEFLEKPIAFPFERDDIYLSLEFQTAMSLIAIGETTGDDNGGDNWDILTQGGILNSRTFGSPVDVKKLWAYDQKNQEHWKTADIKRYFNLLIWAKILLKKRTIMGGLAQLIIINPYLEWYFFANALMRGAAHPETQDTYFAIQTVEKQISHSIIGFVEKYTQSFYENMMKQAEIMA